MKFNLKMYILLAFVAGSHLEACESAPLYEVDRQPTPVLAGRAFAYDGDSIFLGKIEVRLDAIDAPERDQACRDSAGKFWPCGIVARDALRHIIGGGEVVCVLSGKDKYRRLLGICYVDSHDMNRLMVEKGYAIAYHHFSEKYAAQELQAKLQKLGIWQDADFTEPYYCRHLTTGHICYEYDYVTATGRQAELPLIGKSHAVGAPD